MREIHSHEFGGQDSKENAALDEKEEKVANVKLAVDDNVVSVPYVINIFISVINDTHY